MEIRNNQILKLNPNYYNCSVQFCGLNVRKREKAEEIKHQFEYRPEVRKNTSGFLSSMKDYFISKMEYINSSFDTYKRNIFDIHRHRIEYGIAWKEEFGRHGWNSLTHDGAKIFEEIIGISDKKATKDHRAHSSHHLENDKPKDVASIYIDNTVSALKEGKPLSFREYYNKKRDYFSKCPELDIFARSRHFGEDVDLKEVKNKANEILKSPYKFLKYNLEILKDILFGNVLELIKQNTSRAKIIMMQPKL